MSKNETIVTPFGVLQWPYLTKEDPKFGKYKTQIKLTSAELKDLRKKGEAFVKENFKGKKIKGMPFKELDDIGEVFMASSNYKPVLVGSKNAPVDLDGKDVGAGTLARLMGFFFIGNDTLTFKLQKVQIKNLVLKSGNGEEFPDDDEDEGDDSFPESDELDI